MSRSQKSLLRDGRSAFNDSKGGLMVRGIDALKKARHTLEDDH